MIPTTKVLTALILFGSYLRPLLTRHPSHRLMQDQTEQQRLSHAFLLWRASFLSLLPRTAVAIRHPALFFWFFLSLLHIFLSHFSRPACFHSRQGRPGL